LERREKLPGVEERKMDHPAVVRGYESNDDVIREMHEMPKLFLEALIFYLAEDIELHAIKDIERGRKKLGYAGLKLSGMLRTLTREESVDYRRWIDTEHVDGLKGLADEIGKLRYDAMVSFMEKMHVMLRDRLESRCFPFRKASRVIEKMWEISEPFMESSDPL
jgi:hypothetical protein